MHPKRSVVRRMLVTSYYLDIQHTKASRSLLHYGGDALRGRVARSTRRAHNGDFMTGKIRKSPSILLPHNSLTMCLEVHGYFSGPVMEPSRDSRRTEVQILPSQLVRDDENERD